VKILLTGACGVLGRGVRRVAGDAHRFVLFDQAPEVEQADGGIRATITDRDAIRRAAEGCDAIIHLAAMHGAFFGKTSDAEFITTNVVGAAHLFEAAMQFQIPRVVMASTMEVLIGRNWGGYGTTVLDETLPPRPDWIYPVTKFQVETLGHLYAQKHGLQVVQLRYMAFDDVPFEKLGLALLSRYLSVEDAARATLLAATKSGLRDDVFHIGPDTPFVQSDLNDAMHDPGMVLERYWPGCGEVLRRANLVPEFSHFWPVTRTEHAWRVLGWQPQDTFEKFLHQLGWRRE
jgi:nucleoside-diphosphate-sugar epimerase